MLQDIGDHGVATEMDAPLAILNEVQVQTLAKVVQKRLTPTQWAASSS